VGRVGRGSPAAGRPRPQNETWIAARCLLYEVPLVTLNAAGFTDLTEHHGLVLLAERR
jgi:toxin FitB